MQQLVEALRAVAEPTRLRILHLCAGGELAVSELAQILDQSQPRVSRHLKVLADAGVLVPMREGNWTFYRLERTSPSVAKAVLALVPKEDQQLEQDLARLEDVRQRRKAEADAYFKDHAQSWDAIRQMHIDTEDVDRRLLAQVPFERFRNYLDIGTGTGEILRLVAPRVEEAIGLDNSRDMLAIARDRVHREELSHVSLRLGDMYALPLAAASVDLVTVHHVLHFADAPERVVAEAIRVLRPGGRLLICDFAPHTVEDLRSRYAHRRLGFEDKEVREWFAAAGLEDIRTEALMGEPLTVMIWTADRPGGSARAAGFDNLDNALWI